MNSTMLSAVLHFSEQRLALRWAKENLPEDKYQEIYKSYHAIVKWSAAFFVVCCSPIILAFLLVAVYRPFSTRAEAAATPAGATGHVLARADYDGNFFWTHDSKRYEYALKDFGFCPENYEFGDEVKVYVDDVQNIIKVTAVGDAPDLELIEGLVGFLGAIIVPILLLLGFIPIAYHTFGKPWADFGREFYGR